MNNAAKCFDNSTDVWCHRHVFRPNAGQAKAPLDASRSCAHALAASLSAADVAIIYQPAELKWDLSAVKNHAANIEIYTSLEEIITRLTALAEENSHFVLMSNGSFGGIYQKLQTALSDGVQK